MANERGKAKLREKALAEWTAVKELVEKGEVKADVLDKIKREVGHRNLQNTQGRVAGVSIWTQSEVDKFII